MRMGEAEIPKVDVIYPASDSMSRSVSAVSPRRICEIYGPESSGKTTIALQPSHVMEVSQPSSMRSTLWTSTTLKRSASM